MRVVGYTDPWSVCAGDTLKVMVSSESATFEAEIVRLIHGDVNCAGPGFKYEKVASPIAGSYQGRVQLVRSGSYIKVSDLVLDQATLGGLTLQAWIWPTLLDGREQVIMAYGENGGCALVIGEDGALRLRLFRGGTTTESVCTNVPLRERAWHFVAAAVDFTTGRVHLEQRPKTRWPVLSNEATADAPISAPKFDRGGPFYIAAHGRSDGTITAHYNGKVDQPRIFGRALTPGELDVLRRTNTVRVSDGVIADWDFSIGPDSTRVRDIIGDHDGIAVNMPTRGVTGHNWTGRETRFSLAPNEYAAIHFHDDDLEDADWQPAFTIAVPQEWRSGIYAVHLSVDGFEDFVPFFVTPPPGQSKRAAIAVLLPTYTYLAYANEHIWSMKKRLDRIQLSLSEFVARATPYEAAIFNYMLDANLRSLYDEHRDGSAVCYSSRLRPTVNLRPRYNSPNLQFKSPHLISGDLYLIDWLDAKGYEFDVITDEELHRTGRASLDSYRTVLSGSHPEYWTESMLESLDEYLGAGGRFMYLGGNGFYWVTSVDPSRPHVIEVRRGFTGSRTLSSNPGELYHSTTGELGGLWRHRGRTPQALVGVGFTAQGGSSAAQPYRRSANSNDQRVAWIFEGVADEVIGDFGLHLGGAAGLELDRADYTLGTPPHAIVLASSFGHSDRYQRANEESLSTSSDQGGSEKPIRADMTFFETPNGGAVFSVGSISWCGSLSHNNYQNNVSQIMANVLNEFSRQALTTAEDAGRQSGRPRPADEQ
jgi:N,N-dimethylformamidase